MIYFYILSLNVKFKVRVAARTKWRTGTNTSRICDLKKFRGIRAQY